MTDAKICYIGIGANLDDPVRQVERSLTALEQLADVELGKTSSLYLSDPMGPANQPRYVNAVAELRTVLPALALLDSLQQIELNQNRERSIRWGARTLDLDILLYGSHVIRSVRLTVPHPGIAERSFVLMPLVEIAPDIVIPGAGSAAVLLQAVPGPGIEKYEEQTGSLKHER